MKTIDLLVQELPALGGWPDGAVEAGFLCSDDTLFFVNEDGDCPSAWRINMKSGVEDNCIEVTREQYEAVLATWNGHVGITEAERAIDEMVQLSGVSIGAAKILYDAGYRKG